MSTHVWTVAEAKARFSELLQRAEAEGPQRITRHGRTTAVVVSPSEWEKKSVRKENLAEFLMNSPLRNSGLQVKRLRMKMRKVEL